MPCVWIHLRKPSEISAIYKLHMDEGWSDGPKCACSIDEGLAGVGPGAFRPISPGASLHAGPWPEMGCEARAFMTVPKAAVDTLAATRRVRGVFSPRTA